MKKSIKVKKWNGGDVKTIVLPISITQQLGNEPKEDIFLGLL